MQHKRFAIDLMNSVADYCDAQAKIAKDAQRAEQFVSISARLTDLAEKIAVEEGGDDRV